MKIIPAIDLRNGNCVRLRQGNYALEQVYSSDPVALALQWQAAGAKALQLIDLDGARTGTVQNVQVITAIAAQLTIPIQVGGGIQSVETIEQLLSMGVSKVIIGTLALEDEQRLQQCITTYGDKIIVSLDSKDGQLLKRGWLKDSGKQLLATAQRLEQVGVQSFIYTDILKDGTLTQPNYVGISELRAAVSVPITIAGGVSSVTDIKRLSAVGVAGVIVGRALLEGRLTIEEANNVG